MGALEGWARWALLGALLGVLLGVLLGTLAHPTPSEMHVK